MLCLTSMVNAGVSIRVAALRDWGSQDRVPKALGWRTVGEGALPVPSLVSLALGELAQNSEEVGLGFASARLATLDGAE